MSRFKVINVEDMSVRQREVAQAISNGPRGALKGPFLALIHNPELASRVQALGEHLRFGTELPPALVEIAVLVTARRWSCQYEWAAHARIAREAGLAENIIESLATQVKLATLTPDETMIHDFAFETVWEGKPSDASYDAVTARYSAATALDIIALCGYYTMLAFVLNTADFPLPEGSKPLLPVSASRAAPVNIN